MTRQYYQDPNYNSGHHHAYQAPYYYPNPPQQPGPSTQPFKLPFPDPRDTYNDRSSQPEHPKDLYSGSGAYPQPYLKSSQKMPNLSAGRTHQQGLQGSYGYPSTGSSSSDRQFYPGGVFGGDSNSYLPHGGGYNAARPQDRKAAGHDRGHNSGPKPPKRPGHPHANTHRLCRIPHCNNPAFFDRRVDEFREWCSDKHMQLAIIHRVEKPCKACQVWPSLNGYDHCSGNNCRNPGLFAHVW
ncbi:hypothetical protein DFH94DRAFT_712180 [Russula ochroleuca]|uniref:Uncharacterized protein n=1 Tax=Russula ochroleuca TaxID=152965 RepID=A0A9P5TDU4_9AGAM|nr:hypothetical protein DFH94DRAFT_712180 [Russula ochroleuca]